MQFDHRGGGLWMPWHCTLAEKETNRETNKLIKIRTKKNPAIADGVF
jgi:hypothetical protein